MNALHILALFSVLVMVNGWNFNFCLWNCHWRKRGLKRTEKGKCDVEKNTKCARTAKDGKVRMSCLSLCPDHTEDESTKDGHLVSMPENFNFYDLSSKGCFSYQNFLDAFGAREENDPKMRVAFDLADTNGDGCIDPPEFINSPWVFADKEHFASDTGDQVKYDEEDRKLLEKVRLHEKISEEPSGEENLENADLSEKIRAIKRMLYQNRY